MERKPDPARPSPTIRRVTYMARIPGRGRSRPSTPPILIPAEQRPGPSGYRASWAAPGTRAPGSVAAVPVAPTPQVSAAALQRQIVHPMGQGVGLPVRTIKREVPEPQVPAGVSEGVVDISSSEEEYEDARGTEESGPAPARAGPVAESVREGPEGKEVEVKAPVRDQATGTIAFGLMALNETIQRRDRRRFSRQQRRVQDAAKEGRVVAVTPEVATRSGGYVEVIGKEGEWMKMMGGGRQWLPPGCEVVRGDGFFCYCPSGASSTPGEGSQQDELAKWDMGPGEGGLREMPVITPPVPPPSDDEGKGGAWRKRKAGEMLQSYQAAMGVMGGQCERERTVNVRRGERRMVSAFLGDQRPYWPVVRPSYPDRVDLRKEGRNSPWNVLKIREQSEWLFYPDLPRFATDTSDHVDLPFRDLDIYLIYTFLRLRRVDYDEEWQKTKTSSADKVIYQWWSWYGNALQKMNNEEDLFTWKSLAFILACSFVLRRAFAEEAFRTALLSLSVQTDVVGQSMVLQERYGEVLHWVKRALVLDRPPMHPDISQKYMIGDSMIARWGISYSSRQERQDEASAAKCERRKAMVIPLERGYVGGFRVLPIRGADVRTVSWLTQGVLMPHTQAIIWQVGTNNMEAVPPKGKDDRTPEEKAAGPDQVDAKGKKLWTNFPRVAFTLTYHARAVLKTAPQLQGLFFMEILPRFSDDLTYSRRRYGEGDPHVVPNRLRKVKEVNRMLRELVSVQPEQRLAVMPAYDLTDNPEYFTGEKGKIELHMADYARMWYILQEVTGGVNAMLR